MRTLISLTFGFYFMCGAEYLIVVRQVDLGLSLFQTQVFLSVTNIADCVPQYSNRYNGTYYSDNIYYVCEIEVNKPRFVFNLKILNFITMAEIAVAIQTT